MKPVKQSKLYYPDAIHSGNCLAACLASLLELPLWMVPPFEDMFGRNEWRARISEWLKLVHDMEMVRTDGHQPEGLPEFYVTCGMSSRGVGHAVIYSAGALVHDPHPSGDGVVKVDWTWHLAPITVASDEWAPVVPADVP